MKNPVYYIQYAFVRSAGIERKFKDKAAKIKTPNGAVNFDLLKTEEDKMLILRLIEFPEVIEDIAMDYQVSRLARYALELAKAFHNFYEKERVIGEKPELALARFQLNRAAKIVLENTLSLLGVARPRRM
jgi:arginyl-tRNA synthetase